MKVQGYFHTAARAFCLLAVIAVCAASGAAQAATVILSGYVTRASDASPIAGAVVSSSGLLSPPAQTTTDSTGHYLFEYLCVLHCSVSATADGYVTEARSYADDAGAVVSNFALAVEAKISGRITLPAGSGVTMTTPRIERFDENTGEWTGAFARGEDLVGDVYSYTKLHAGIYRVCYEDPALLRQCYDRIDQGPLVGFDYTPIELSTGDARTNVDFSLGTGSTVGGRLVDGYANANLPGLNASIAVFDENGGAVGYPRSVVSDADGRYAFAGLAPGNYYLMATNGAFLSRVYPSENCYYDDCDPLVQGTPVTVPPGGATNIDFALHPHAVVRARVVDAADGSEINNATFASWIWAPFLGGPGPVSRHWYDASTAEYVSYNSVEGGRVGAAAPGYIARFVVAGNCPDLVACASAANRVLVQPRGEVHQVELRLSRADDYLFTGDFE